MPLARRIFLLVSGAFVVLLSITAAAIALSFSSTLVATTEATLQLVMQQNQRTVNAALTRVDGLVVDLDNDRYLYEQLVRRAGERSVDQSIARQEIGRHLIRTVYVPLRTSFSRVNYWFFVDERVGASDLYRSYVFPASRISTTAQAVGQPFYAAAIAADGRVAWSSDPARPGRIRAASVIRGLFSPVAIPDLGILLIELDVADLLGDVQRSGIGDRSGYLLIDPAGIIHPVGAEAPAVLPEAVWRVLRGERATARPIADGDRLYSVLRLDNGWQLVGITPIDGLNQHSLRVANVIALITIIALGVVLLLSFIIARSVSRPIASLAHAMRQADLAGAPALADRASRDTLEIAALYAAYQAQISHIRQLLAQVYQSGIEVKQAEIRALQAQINPHFLYNTLDAISWSARDQGVADVPAIVSSLANILRYSIDDSERPATLAEELAIVADYLAIQNYCYGLAITLDATDVADLVGNVPRLTLQPIVENAILHGFLERGVRAGAIRLRGIVLPAGITIEIENPGPADIAALQALLDGPAPPRRHGMRNVHRRLRMLFGDAAGLSVHAAPGGGLVVALHLPAAGRAAAPGGG
ncbi:MAG: histidine kinase [Chloroflexi bacterium]|nr:histidine kinase [Chloroflexota bacterium]